MFDLSLTIRHLAIPGGNSGRESRPAPYDMRRTPKMESLRLGKIIC
jgi:hypothetical protein